MRSPSRRPWVALACDESGNLEEPWLCLAGVSGPLEAMLDLERRLRAVLRNHGVAELKWARLRTKKAPLAAAADFLELCRREAAEGRLAADLVLLQSPLPGPWRGSLERRRRWMALYLELLRRARRRWRGRRLAALPDQRTGLPWAALKRQGRVAWLRPFASRQICLIQLADLLAGLARFAVLGAPGWTSGAAARDNRRRLLRALPLSMGGGALRMWKFRKLQGV